ncbi:MAG: hypothetical protein M1598_06595, partial [Actinobacteria bacterium]|nr:hypothetical protein [Actinomycetota bacterium]
RCVRYQPHPNASDACIHHIEKRRAAEQVAPQQARDLIKQGICVREGIQLVVVPSQDLSLQGMLEKVGISCRCGT